ncbi:Dyp-type peroxidase [Marinobacterium mangrovicola]|uniref:Putative iron-dependent peroxidase n=1 Tax=Marinobacterium mangrovicola TaxID=1476959 RepID=A0A4R1GJF0_9GAMM|nr:Dyp-type peroxidase [Marinobacterium mangrovicola]TCK08507.1 putative iron-dependent peroxidase [Marinobacterium mangrovicola]
MNRDYQTGVIAESSRDALFLSFNAIQSPGNEQKIRQVLAQLPQMLDEVRAEMPNKDLHLVAGIGSAYWDQVSPHARPELLRPFPALENGQRVAPSTPVDMLFIVRAAAYDACLELASRIGDKLAGLAKLEREIHGFRYKDTRDMTGFVDGTENPEGDDRLEVALVGDEDPEFAGGSYLHVQVYEHNLDAWNQIPVKEQEDAYGRTKEDNVEYPCDKKSPHAHTKRTSLKDADGNSMEILRHSMPYGDSTCKGLVFVSTCRTPEHYELMLNSMVNGDEEGRADRILEFTRAVFGAAFFVPSNDWLRSLK